MSWHLLRFTLLPGVALGTLLVLATISVVAAAVRFRFLPGLSWTASLLLGVVAAVFDTRLFHEAKGRPHVPRAIADTLKARELVARIAILATFGSLFESMGTERFAVALPLKRYASASRQRAPRLDGRAARGLGGRGLVRAGEIAVSVATPYAAALAAPASGSRL